MKVYNVGKYIQIEQNGNISCTCMWSSLFPLNYQNGDKICRHIVKLIRKIKNEK